MAGQDHRHPLRGAHRGVDLREDPGSLRGAYAGLPGGLPAVCGGRRQQRPLVFPAGPGGRRRVRPGRTEAGAGAGGCGQGPAQLRPLRARVLLVGRLRGFHGAHRLLEPAKRDSGPGERQHPPERLHHGGADRGTDFLRHLGPGESGKAGAGRQDGPGGGLRHPRRGRLKRGGLCGLLRQRRLLREGYPPGDGDGPLLRGGGQHL